MPNQMTKGDSQRVQSTQAKAGNNRSSNSFAARAQAAGDRHNNPSTGYQSGAAGTRAGSGQQFGNTNSGAAKK